MPTQYNLKPGFKIYFLTVWFEDKVYAFGSGLGFTDVIYSYAIAETEEQALSLAHEKYDQEQPKVRKISASCARNQYLNRYCFTENMVGVEKGAAIS